jgi:hypothetical protein
MSWQATAWAERRKTGSPSAKVLLLVLANYADDSGRCWPSQTTLASGAELSMDTVQRQLRRLEANGHIRRTTRVRKAGRWPQYEYQLCMAEEASTEPQNAARSACGHVDKSGSPGRTVRHHRAAPCGITGPQALRHEPSIEPSIEPSPPPPRQSVSTSAQRSGQASKRVREMGSEVYLARIAQRIAAKVGGTGWEPLMDMEVDQVAELTRRERFGELTDESLGDVLKRFAREKTRVSGEVTA